MYKEEQENKEKAESLLERIKESPLNKLLIQEEDKNKKKEITK